LRRFQIVIDHIPGFEHDMKGRLVTGLAAHKARLDVVTGAFGEDRVIFNTNYPESYGVRTIPQIVGIVKEYYATKSREAAEKAFWKNSLAFYKWIRRAPDQPSP